MDTNLDAVKHPNVTGRYHLRTILAFSLAALVAGLAVNRREEICAVLAAVKFQWAVAGFGCYAVTYLLRAVRLRRLTHGALRLWPEGIGAVISHNALTYLMPMRTGDIALPAILRSACSCTWGEGVKVLMQARAFDLNALGMWVLGAALVLPVSLSPEIRVFWILCGIGFVALPFIVSMASHANTLKPQWLFRYAQYLAVLRGRDIPSRALSLGIWAMFGGVMYCTARAVGIELAAGDAWFLATIQLPLQLMPLQGFANTGNHEMGWSAGLLFLGYAPDQALSFALATHAVIFSYVMVMLLAGVLISSPWLRGGGARLRSLSENGRAAADTSPGHREQELRKPSQCATSALSAGT